MGIARLALAVLAVVGVVALLVLGARALITSFDTPQEPSEFQRATAEASASVPVPTVHIACVADTCPLVTVRVPGGDVLQYRDMTRGEEVSYFEPELDVVLTDASSVRVTANGEPRAPGEPGKREAFTVRGR
ncbi:hypothetical protein [Nonomuraea sp. NPDC048916]|uniref:hypothetical protein n=1 Tax=Nonomuraea sp. NPDC048916 TaxID=3154232 RepID=UPI003407CD82